MNDRQPRGRWKSVQYDYDALSALDDDESCLYCLSARDVMLVLSSLDYFAWKTRYISPSNTAIDQETIDEWQGHLGERLMSCLAIRQNPDNPCLLQQQNDDGTWTTWANLRYCPPKLKFVSGGIVVELPDDTFYTPTEDDTFDGRDVPYTPPVRTDPTDDAICLAAENAVNVIYTLHGQVFSGVFVPTATWVALTLVTVIIGILALPVALAILVSVIVAGGGVAILSDLELADFTLAVRKRLKCILVAFATNTAGVVTFDFAAVQSDVASRIVGINIWSAINLYLTIIGESGLNRAGATTEILIPECDDCGNWCYRFDDDNRLSEWTSEVWSGDSASVATYSGGEWHSACFTSGHTVDFMHLEWVLASPITLIDAGIINATGSCTGGGQGIWVNGDGSIFSGTQVWAAGGGFTNPHVPVTRLTVLLFCIDGGCPDIVASQIQFSGEGDDNPFGEDNC